MEIGQKLREARQERGLTQEELSERLHVSRQTISNWENQRSYPDIISLIALSDLYGISLDELVKEDKQMIGHLKESTDTVRSREKLWKLILLAIYMALWVMCVLSYWITHWLGGMVDAMGYSLLVFYLLLPLATLAVSIAIGKGPAWAEQRWLMLLFLGLMFMLAPYATFSLSHMLYHSIFYLPRLADMLPGILCAGLGMGIGAMLRRGKERKMKAASRTEA